jgi:hypothetical protein
MSISAPQTGQLPKVVNLVFGDAVGIEAQAER